MSKEITDIHAARRKKRTETPEEIARRVLMELPEDMEDEPQYSGNPSKLLGGDEDVDDKE
ncbi:hypothetical protein [Mangrovitalea sediminis]|uniref:hypothetical protein n=1 Tax=Mangrovitalea sediminis TaxID=1982043 RepID=UPI000BE4E171|nr:hypothetical protein [Mangrovitalea sediminis]